MGEWEIENRDRRSRLPSEGASKFERWVLEMGGTQAVGDLVGAHQITVCAWIAGRTVPKLEFVVKILKLAGKSLTLEDIVEGTRTRKKIKAARV